MGRGAGRRLGLAPANLITGSLAVSCLRLSERAVFIPPGRSRTGRFKLNQALVPGSEWAIHWPRRPLAKQTPGPYGAVGEIGGPVARPCSSLHGPAQKGCFQGPWAQVGLGDRCWPDSHRGRGKPREQGPRESQEPWLVVQHVLSQRVMEPRKVAQPLMCGLMCDMRTVVRAAVRMTGHEEPARKTGPMPGRHVSLRPPRATGTRGPGTSPGHVVCPLCQPGGPSP